MLQLLPADKRKVIFFVPEAARPQLATGGGVAVACDGCAAGLGGDDDLPRQRGGIHAAGHLQPREPRQADVPRRGAASGDAARLPLGQPVDVTPALGGTQ